MIGYKGTALSSVWDERLFPLLVFDYSVFHF